MAKARKRKPTLQEWISQMDTRLLRWQWRGKVAEARAAARKWSAAPEAPRGRSRRARVAKPPG